MDTTNVGRVEDLSKAEREPEIPLYTTSSVVGALEISKVEYNRDAASFIHFKDQRFSSKKMQYAWYKANQPATDEGYLVFYKGGKMSWMSKEMFEKNYKQVKGGK